MCKSNSQKMEMGVLAARFACAVDGTTTVSGAMVMDALKLKMISERQLTNLGVTARLRRKGEDFATRLGKKIATQIGENMERRAAQAAAIAAKNAPKALAA